MADILIVGQELAANTNLLANSRLETMPAGARYLHFRCAADVSNGTNAMGLTIELPSGLIPMDGQQVLAAADNIIGALDERTLMQWTWEAETGGRFIISVVDLVGTATILTWLAHLT